METIEMIAYHRKLGTKASLRALRAEGMVPCVIYGQNEPLHAAVPAILFRPLTQRNEAAFISLNLEGRKLDCILQEAQYHPVAGHLTHVDFLMLQQRPIKMRIPLYIKGQAPGMLQGGKLQRKLRSVVCKALPEDMPSRLEVDISDLELGGTIKVKDLPHGKYQIMEREDTPLLGLQVPKALRGGDAPEEEEAPETEAEEVNTATTDA